VLQKLRETLSAATELVAEIALRFQAGDPAEEPLAQLHTLLTALPKPTADLPDELRAEIAQLLSRVQETVAVGEAWLTQAGPELESEQLRQRLRRTYGVT
jgi:hypothetical protein